MHTASCANCSHTPPATHCAQSLHNNTPHCAPIIGRQCPLSCTAAPALPDWMVIPQQITKQNMIQNCKNLKIYLILIFFRILTLFVLSKISIEILRQKSSFSEEVKFGGSSKRLVQTKKARSNANKIQLLGSLGHFCIFKNMGSPL